MYYISPATGKKHILPVEDISICQYTDKLFIGYGTNKPLIDFLYDKYKNYFYDKEHLALKIEGYYCSCDSYFKQLELLNNYLARYISTFFDLETMKLLY